MCLLAVPTDMELGALESFVSAGLNGSTAVAVGGEDGVSGVGGGVGNVVCVGGIDGLTLERMHDTALDTQVVWVDTKSQQVADLLYTGLNGVVFDAAKPATCSVVFLATVALVLPDGRKHTTTAESLSETATRSSGLCDLVELPACPACLERLDLLTSGMPVPSCEHTGSCGCAAVQWNNARCNACLFHNKATPSGESVCVTCGTTESLWGCMICGHIGCGRYSKKHSVDHFQETRHSYAMELGTQRVWDYTGDSYVHRWMQTEGDGTLVRLPDSRCLHNIHDALTDAARDSEELAGGEASDATSTVARGAAAGVAGGGGDGGLNPPTTHKVESIVDEFRHLLTSQLDAQRSYYEDKVRDLRADFEDHVRRQGV